MTRDRDRVIGSGAIETTYAGDKVKVKRVAVIVGTEGAFGRRVALGVRAYARGKLNWVFQFHRPDVRSLQNVVDWRADGLITEVWEQNMVEPVLAMGIPTVELSDWGLGVPIVTVDNTSCGRFGAQYYIDRKYRHFGYANISDNPFSRKRRDGFIARVAEEGLKTEVFERPRDFKGLGDWSAFDEALKVWLRMLPKPIGILTDNDGKALQLMEAARQADFHIPEQVAVLGVDNDDVLCELAQPPLSSIATAADRIGYEACKLLEQLMRGKRSRGPILLPPVNVVTRHSSDVFAIEDNDLADVMRYIRTNAQRPFKLAEIFSELALSRRNIERSFIKNLGRSLLDEVHRVRVDMAKQLLCHTDLPIWQVAERVGFSDLRRLSIVFGKEVGVTPGRFRRQFRLRE